MTTREEKESVLPVRAKTTADVWLPKYMQVEDAIEHEDFQAARKLLHYWWAWVVLHRAKAKLAYDVYCGCGFGTHILVEQQPHEMFVMGFDPSKSALAYAKGEHTIEGKNSFEQLDLDEVGFFDAHHNAPVNAVVCFDTFTYLKHRDAFLASVVEMLDPEGWLLLSCQRGSMQKMLPDMLFSKYDLTYLLKRFFGEVYAYEDDRDNFPSRDYLMKFDPSEVPLESNDHTAHFTKGLFACTSPIKIQEL